MQPKQVPSCATGWFVTGDTAAVDEDGFIRIVKE